MLAHVNYFGAIVATILAFGLGGFWYSPVMFAKVWMRESKVDPKDVKPGHGSLVYLAAIVFTFLTALAFSAWIGPTPGLAYALKAAVIVGVFFVGTCFWVNYLFCGRSNTLFFIDAGYHLAQFVIYGLVFGCIRSETYCTFRRKRSAASICWSMDQRIL